jgi:hypothetical protein
LRIWLPRARTSVGLAERIADRFPGNVSSADEVEAFIRDLTESKQ